MPTSFFNLDNCCQSLSNRGETEIHERAYKRKLLSEAQQISNTGKSCERSKAEHVLGYQESSMVGKILRLIGISTAKVEGGR